MHAEKFQVQTRTLSLSVELQKTEKQAFLQLWRACELLSAGFGILGWMTATADYEVRYAQGRNYWNCDESTEGSTVLQWMNVILTLISLLFLILRHVTKRNWSLKKLKSASHEHHLPEKLSISKFSHRLGAEILLLCVFPYPGVTGKVYIDERHKKSAISTDFITKDVCYTAAEVLYALMFLRFFFVLRAGINLSPFMDGHSRKVCRRFGVKSNIRFATRSLVRFRPLWVLVVFLLPTALLAAVLIRVFERPYVGLSDQDFGSYTNSVYYTYVTMTTLAYGDFYAWTELGRFIAILIGVWGMAVFSMMIYVMDTTIATNPAQLQAFRAIKRTREAASVLDSFFYYLHLRKDPTVSRLIVSLAYQSLKLRSRLFTVKMSRIARLKALKEKDRKTIHEKLDELESVVLRAEIKAGTTDKMEGELGKISELIEKFCEQAFGCTVGELPA